MKSITCKVPLVRNMAHQGSLDGMEGPAKKAIVNEYNESINKGEISTYYNCRFTEKFNREGQPYFDGEVEIPDTEFNRKKIAAMVRHKDLKVLDAGLQSDILAKYPAPPKKKREKMEDGTFKEVEPEPTDPETDFPHPPVDPDAPDADAPKPQPDPDAPDSVPVAPAKPEEHYSPNYKDSSSSGFKGKKPDSFPAKRGHSIQKDEGEQPDSE